MKTFTAYWSEDFAQPGTQEVDSSFFTEPNGYDQDDIDGIEALEVGQVWESEQYGTNHTVTRVS